MPPVVKCAQRAGLAAALGLASFIPAPRGQALPDTVDLESLLAAVEASPAVRAAAIGAAAAEAGAQGAGLWEGPELEVMLRPAALLGAEGERLELRATQPLPIPSRLRAERAAAGAMAEAERFGVAVESAERRLRVRLAYYALYRAQQEEALIRAYIRRLGAFAEVAAVRYEVGRGTQGAVLQAQLEAGRLEEELRALATMRHDALAELAAVLGFPSVGLHAEAHVEGPVAVALPPLPPETDSVMVARALDERPELDALASEARAADANVDLARLAFRPEFGLSVSLMNATGDGLVGPNMLGIGAMVRIPVARRQLRARVDEARLRRSQLDVRLLALTREVEAAVAHHAYAARRESETLRLYERRLIPQAEATVESLLAGYTTGQSALLDLLDAERTRLELAIGLEEARYRYLVAMAELTRAVGEPAATPSRTQP
jgi:outer membrane protein TolC